MDPERKIALRKLGVRQDAVGGCQSFPLTVSTIEAEEKSKPFGNGAAAARRRDGEG